MARPLLIDGKFPMRIFTNNGYRYAVTRTSVRKADGRYNHPQKLWGTVDENLNFTPNSRFLALSAEERAAILIPENWKIAHDGAGVPAGRGRPSYDGASASLLYGHSWFLEMLSAQCGLRDDLEHVFESRDMADKVLTLAYYSLLCSGSYSHLAGEQAIAWFPSGDTISAWEATRLTASITEQHRQALFRCRRARSGAKSWLGVDSTSFTCYGRHLADAKRGKNKEHDHADQINELVIYDFSGGAPVYYRRMPGNMPDTRAMRVTMEELKANGYSNVSLVLDRGYVSDEVMEMLVKRNCSFVMMARTGDSQIAKAIRETDYEEMTSRQCWIDRHRVFGKTMDYKYSVTVNCGKRDVSSLRMCLFFDPEQQGEVRKEVYAKATEMERQLQNMKDDRDKVDAETIERYSRYFDIRLTRQGRIRCFSMNERNMKKDIARTGYFAILANAMSPSRHDLSEILDIYGMRDEQEKSFMFIKSEQEGRRLRTSREDTTDGRLFIQFVALILNCAIYRRFLASDTLRELFPTRQHMLEELRSIRMIRHPKRARMITEIVGRQVDVFKEFKMPVPVKLLPKDRRQEYAQALAQNG